MEMKNRKAFDSAKQGNNEKYCSRKESQDYSKKGECNLPVEINKDLGLGIFWSPLDKENSHCRRVVNKT